MSHPDPHVRAARWPARVLFLGLALAALSACASDQDGRSPSSATAPVSGHSAPAAQRVAVTHAIPTDITDLVLPVTGADTRWAQGLDALGRLAADKATRQCLASHDASMPPQPPVSFLRYSAVPDLDFIARHGFNGVPVPDGAAATPRDGSPATAAPAGPDAAQRTCLTRGSAVGNDFRTSYLRLQTQWWQEVASLNSAPEVRSAFGEFGRCLAGHRTPAKDESAFFDLVDRRLQAGDTDRSLGALYATCMKPVEDTREPLRERLRDKFREEHRGEVEKVRTTLPRTVRDLERRYDIRISFPAP
ncbi:hypothetical protein [Streptomyces mirabilis]|uniref:hypothetical protein n=1 Tax=Streptomyces mirabilis TaxID=68239 RepID=UPI00224D2D39|nr:hypothetical protein [Streptomyces mirabilis]MCX4610742.1 hypothetical protein [Streptomyces mirabilis]